MGTAKDEKRRGVLEDKRSGSKELRDNPETGTTGDNYGVRDLSNERTPLMIMVGISKHWFCFSYVINIYFFPIEPRFTNRKEL